MSLIRKRKIIIIITITICTVRSLKPHDVSGGHGYRSPASRRRQIGPRRTEILTILNGLRNRRISTHPSNRPRLVAIKRQVIEVVAVVVVAVLLQVHPEHDLTTKDNRNDICLTTNYRNVHHLVGIGNTGTRMRGRPRRRHLVDAGNQIDIIAVGSDLVRNHRRASRRHGAPAAAVGLPGTRAEVVRTAGLRGDTDTDVADGVAGRSGHVHTTESREDMLEGQRVFGLVSAVREVRADHIRGVAGRHRRAVRMEGQRGIGGVEFPTLVRSSPHFPARINGGAGTRHLRERSGVERTGFRAGRAGHGTDVKRRKRSCLRGPGGRLGLDFDVRISAEDDLIPGKVPIQRRLLKLQAGHPGHGNRDQRNNRLDGSFHILYVLSFTFFLSPFDDTQFQCSNANSLGLSDVASLLVDTRI